MIQRRAGTAGIKTRIGNHTFRATGITAYLQNKGTQFDQIAAGLVQVMDVALVTRRGHHDAALVTSTGAPPVTPTPLIRR